MFKDIIIKSKIIHFIGMARSGNHAVINWILQKHDNPIFLNNRNDVNSPFLKLHQNNYDDEQIMLTQDYNLMVISSEFDSLEKYLKLKWELKNESKKIIPMNDILHIFIVRDPFNLFASRMSHVRPYAHIKNIKKFCEEWKTYAREFLGITNYIPNKLPISYNKWFSNKRYRRKLTKTIGGSDVDSVNNITSYGNGSSFDKMKFNGKANQMKVLERWKHYARNELFLEMLEDKELMKLSNKIFGNIIKKKSKFMKFLFR
jgi:hypothetical protein